MERLTATFGQDGITKTDVNPVGMVQQSDSIVLAGTQTNSGYPGMIRVSSSGLGDSNFSFTSSTVVSGFKALGVNPNGSLVVTGSSMDGDDGEPQNIVFRTNADGDVDPFFGENGIVTVGYETPSGRLYAIGIEPDGRIVVVGTTSTATPIVIRLWQ